ncbi:MAG: DNA-3-methyladenine glycosylase 2 family protein [Bacteroidales bacterium]
MKRYFRYGKEELDHLQRVDPLLGAVIKDIGAIKREVNPNLFEALLHTITGQQISTKAHITVWKRMVEGIGEITPHSIVETPLERLQQFGISFRKGEYIKLAAQKVYSKELDLETLTSLPDNEVIDTLTKVKGIGPWSAEMLLLFSMERPNILSWGDLAIHRGMQRLYSLPEIGREQFNRYHSLYTPYASVASLYIWEVATNL